MKLQCEVLRVETTGDGLRVHLQGKPPTAADWRTLAPQTIELPDNQTTRRAFYVGRRVWLTVNL